MPTARREIRTSFPPRHTPGAPRHFLLLASLLLTGAMPATASEATAKPPTGKPTTARVLGISGPLPKIVAGSGSITAWVDDANAEQTPAGPYPKTPVRTPIRLQAEPVTAASQSKPERIPPVTPVESLDSRSDVRDTAQLENQQPGRSILVPIEACQELSVTRASEEARRDQQTSQRPSVVRTTHLDDEPAEEAEETADDPTAGDPFIEEAPERVMEAVETPQATASVNEFGLKPMARLTTDILLPQPKEGVPEDLAAPRFEHEGVIASAEFVGRDWTVTDYRWEASMLCHGPLLFEQLNAERYGITYGCMQPVVSAAHFFVTVPALPYKVWAQGHDHCQYVLGFYRPGSPAKPQCYRPRISADAGLFEAGVIVGLIYILP